jgi:hypothetical protein
MDLSKLSLESQRAYEILETLRTHQQREARFKIMGVAGATDPLQVKSLHNVATYFASLGMPLDQTGLAQFKADRGLGGGTAVGIDIALAYARAVDGDEVLVRISKGDESAMNASERAVFEFFRTFQRRRTAVDLRPLKVALGLRNPPMSEAAKKLKNEYVGLSTIREVSKASSMHHVPLGPELAPRLLEKLKAGGTGAATPATAARGAPKAPPTIIPRGPRA